MPWSSLHMVRVEHACPTLHQEILVPTFEVPRHAGSGSSRFSPRNRFVAGELQKRGISTLLCDLLTKEEEIVDDRTGHLRFDITFLAKRLNECTNWVKSNKKELADFKVGYFGASTGGGAALEAAAERKDVGAVVSRGGRPDLASKEALAKVKAPTLLLVGGLDGPVIQMNESAMASMKACDTKKLVIVPGATHLFPEKGKLEEVAKLASDWMEEHLTTHTETQKPSQS